ncbi:related to MFS transporter [Ramularia collo-cygni]|uniref:Related to MFS transporter n=1 Tax=Ramularia collo-cygni TaxID=112498 RepID=A0A2D3V0C4_9PEZI|nr:related to MFS transporter [Ramularia collo-cygni]CZT23767.1 related to MFS transporter [Ramularia collo-cygni]
MSDAGKMPDVEIVPGTVVMKNVDDGNVKRALGNGLVLSPQPSCDLNDPLNWSTTWKLITATSQLLYVWVLVCSALSLAPLFPLLGQEFHLDQQQLSLLTGTNVLTLGFANVLIVPVANIFGRRPVAIFFGILVVLTNVWQAIATSHESLLAARACNGIAAATSETIMVQTIADMFFLHERATWMAAYFTFYFSGAFLGPIIAGSIGSHYGWRSFFWLSVAMSAFVTVLLIFCYPETKFSRQQDVDDVCIEVPTKDVEQSPVHEKGVTSQRDSGVVDGLYLRKGRPGKTQFAPVTRPEKKWKSFVIRDLTTPILAFFNPIVFWSAMMLAGPADLLLLFNLTQSGLFSSPAYGFTPEIVGYTNFAFFVGGLFGVLTAGPLSDWWASRMTWRNNGVREPEFRLPALFPYCCIFIISHVVGAVGYQRLWPWQAIVICGFGFSGLAVTSIPAIAIAYAIDCYKPISGEIMVVGTVLKNILGFCLSYWVFDIMATKGWITVYMIQFAVGMFPVALTIPLYLYGKNLRRWTKDSSLHRMESMF